MTLPLLELSALDWAYRDRTVLHDVSFALRSGEILGVAGPNGAGKSTLIRLISRALEPPRGRIFLDGVDITRLPRAALARRIAVVPQSPELPGAFTALELVLLGRTPHLRLLQREGPRDQAIARAALAATQAEELAGRRLGELSGGERQRVVIARALAQEPDLLLLDEPTAHLDLGHQVAVLDLIHRLHRERGLSVLAIFHDLSLAAQFCDRLLLLAGGTIRCAGTPAEVLQAGLLREIYGVEVSVLQHPQSGRPLVIPNGHDHLPFHRPGDDAHNT